MVSNSGVQPATAILRYWNVSKQKHLEQSLTLLNTYISNNKYIYIYHDLNLSNVKQEIMKYTK